MAIDSAEDRRSAATVSFMPHAPGVTLNALKDVEWRQQVGWSYSGIPINFTEPVPADDRLPFVYRRRMNRLRARKR